MLQNFKVIAIGDMSLDVFLELDKAEADVTCSVDRSECKICFNYADKIPVSKLTKTAGGNASNVAIGSCRLGFRSALVATLGLDEEGKFLRETLLKDRVDTRYIRYDERSNLTTCINYLGERTLFVYHEPRNYELPKLPKAKFIYLTSMRSGWEECINPLIHYLDRATVKLAYNPGTYQLRAGIKQSQGLLDRCEILFLNKQEAALFLKIKETTPFHTMLTNLHKTGPRIIVITDGPNGSYASDASGQYKIGIFDVPVIERTGVGDAYATGFMAAIQHGHDITEAMRWGSFESANVLQYIGPQAGLLTMAGLKIYAEKYSTFRAKLLKKRSNYEDSY